jgi:hypothetical protein
MPSLDVTLVSGRRPELLARTLDSFSKGLFRNFEINKFIVNIDPFAGNEDDHDRCRTLITNLYSDSVIIEPVAPSFGRAVKRTWLNSSADFIFHLEDDWILCDTLHPEDVFPLFDSETKAAKLVSAECNLHRSPFQVYQKTKRFLGIPVGRTVFNEFSTSPGFWDGEVAREFAMLINPDLDPEKQIRPQFNLALFTFLNQYRCRFIPSKSGGILIKDIGREWRREKGLEKIVLNGRSIWEVAPDRVYGDK